MNKKQEPNFKPVKFDGVALYPTQAKNAADYGKEIAHLKWPKEKVEEAFKVLTTPQKES